MKFQVNIQRTSSYIVEADSREDVEAMDADEIEDSGEETTNAYDTEISIYEAEDDEDDAADDDEEEP